MIEEQQLRFQAATWNEVESQTIIIGGVGGIGSWLTLFISRLGKHNVHIYDFDTIENHNLGGQLFSVYQIGDTKVIAMEELLQYLNGSSNNILTFSQRYTSDIYNKIMISAFDNMDARKQMFEVWKKDVSTSRPENKDKYLFIDGRLNAEQYQVFTVTPDRIEDYEAYLFSDEEVPDVGACSYRQTSHFAAMIAARMTQSLTNFFGNQIEPDTYELPFLVEEAGPSYFINIKE